MSSIYLKAHFDGEKICLDDNFNFRSGDNLLITVIKNDNANNDTDDLYNLSLFSIGRAFGDNESEYPINLIKDYNSEYRP